MEITHVTIVAVYIVTVTSAYYDSNIPGFGALNLDTVLATLSNRGNGFNNVMRKNHMSNSHHHDGLRDQAARQTNTYRGHASQAGLQGARASLKGFENGRNQAKHDNAYSKDVGQLGNSKSSRGYISAADGIFDKIDGSFANGFNSGVANKKAYKNGNNFDDNVVYSFDKVYDKNMTERGGYEEAEGKDAHRLDQFRDKQKAGKHIKGDHSASHSRKDAVGAAKETKHKQNAAEGLSDHRKTGFVDNHMDKAGATQDAQKLEYDRKNKRHYDEDLGSSEELRQRKKFANKDDVYHRNAAASHAGGQGHAAKTYHGGHNAHGDNHGTTGNDYPGPRHKGHHPGTGAQDVDTGGHAHHRHHEHANESDQGKEHHNQDAGSSDSSVKSYKQDADKGEYALIKNLRDQRQGKFSQGVHNAQNSEYYSKDGNTAKSAHLADRKAARANAHSNGAAAMHDLDDEDFDKNTYIKHEQDSGDKYRKLKRFYHDKSEDGNNYERLKYKRKKAENEYAQSQAANNRHQNQFSRDHKSARHDDVSKKEHFLDDKKASNGHSAQKANSRYSGYADNNGNKYSRHGHEYHGNKKDMFESDSAANKDKYARNQLNHHDGIQGNAMSSANGYKNAVFNKNGNRYSNGYQPVPYHSVAGVSINPSYQNRDLHRAVHSPRNFKPNQYHTFYDPNRAGKFDYINSHPRYRGKASTEYGRRDNYHGYADPKTLNTRLTERNGVTRKIRRHPGPRDRASNKHLPHYGPPSNVKQGSYGRPTGFRYRGY